MEATKIKLLRVLDILCETDETHPLTATQICRKLSLYGIEAERKSVSRDINSLIECGYDILPCADKRLGYFMASRKFEDWELKILIDAVGSAKFLTKASTQGLMEKLISLTSTDGQKLLKRVTPIITANKTKNTSVKTGIDLVLKAIRLERKISFQYLCMGNDLKSNLKRDGFLYAVSPYKLLWENQFYYLICNTEPHENLSYYRLDKMKGITILESPSRPPLDIVGANPDIKISEFAAINIYHYGGEKIRLTLRVQNCLFEKLFDYFGDHLQIENGEAYSRVTVSITDSPGLYFWLLQYGEHIEILAPQSVRETYLIKLNKLLSYYDLPPGSAL